MLQNRRFFQYSSIKLRGLLPLLVVTDTLFFFLPSTRDELLPLSAWQDVLFSHLLWHKDEVKHLHSHLFSSLFEAWVMNE